MDWTEAHRPTALDQLVGNGPAVAALRKWALAWADGTPEKRAVVLAGPPGVGKTSAALALAGDMGWSVIELNASDARNADVIKRVATAGAMHQTFAADGAFLRASEAGRKLIILDEADNLTERLSGENAAGGHSDLSDRGGKAQIVETIRHTRQPIILIVNDLYGLTRGSGSALAKLADTIKFSRINVRSMPKALAAIAQKEGVRIEPDVLTALAAKAEGDLRAAVRDLEAMCAGRSVVTMRDFEALGRRDTSGNIFDTVRHILKGRPIAQVRRESLDLDATPEDMVLWVDENLPKEYKDPHDLVRGYEMLSRADVFLGRTRRTQNYRLWAYAGDLATIGVMTAREQEYRGFTPFGFPQWLSKMSRSRAVRQTHKNLTGHLGARLHMSRRKAHLFQLDPFRALFQADEEFAAHQTFLMDLADDEVAVLLGLKATAKQVKAIREAVDKMEPAAKEAGLNWSPGPRGAPNKPAQDVPPEKPRPDALSEKGSRSDPKGQRKLF